MILAFENFLCLTDRSMKNGYCGLEFQRFFSLSSAVLSRNEVAGEDAAAGRFVCNHEHVNMKSSCSSPCGGYVNCSDAALAARCLQLGDCESLHWNKSNPQGKDQPAKTRRLKTNAQFVTTSTEILLRVQFVGLVAGVLVAAIAVVAAPPEKSLA